MKYTLLYFARLADEAGCHEEKIESTATTPRALYAEIKQRHGFHFTPEHLRVAVCNALVAWDFVLSDGDEIVFLPPVSGG